MATAILLLFSVVLVNGFAAGVAATLFLWREGMARGQRIAISAGATGLGVALLIFAIVLFEQGMDDEPLVAGIAMLIIIGLGGVVSLPGAVAMSRRIERTGSIRDTFS